MDDVGELKQQLEEKTRRLQEVEDELVNAGFDREDYDKLTKDKDTAEEKLAALEKELDEKKKENAQISFDRKRDKALAELGLKPDDPAAKLAFPDGETMPDDTFDARVENLKAIVASRTKSGGSGEGGEKPGEEKPGEADEWKGFKGGLGEGGETDDRTTAEKNYQVAEARFRETLNPRDLAKGGLGGKLVQLVKRRFPGGTQIYEQQEVKE